MKTVGVIGGLGPETSAKFYLEVVSSCQKKNELSRPPILIWNVPIPFKIEKDLITSGKGEEKFLPFLIEAAIKLEKAGADFLVMPCNSMHIFIGEIRNAVTIPVLSIVDETVKVVKKEKIKSVSLLATSITFKRKLFQNSLAKRNVKFKIPQKENQLKLGKIIHSIVVNKQTTQDQIEVMRIIKTIAKSNKTVILACTDLQLIVPEIKGIKIIDTMKILADATINKMQEGLSG